MNLLFVLCTFIYAHKRLIIEKYFVEFHFKRPFLKVHEDICLLSLEGKVPHGVVKLSLYVTTILWTEIQTFWNFFFFF